MHDGIMAKTFKECYDSFFMFSKNILIFIGIIIFVIGAYYMLGSGPQQTQDDPNAPKPPEGYVVPQGFVHWHARLKVMINGAEQNIPGDLGITEGNLIDKHLSGPMGISPM